MKWKSGLVYVLMLTLALTGCGTAYERNTIGSEESGSETIKDTDKDTEDEKANSADENTGAVDLLTDFSEEDQFSKRDLASSYEESEAQAVTLTEDGAQTTSKAVSIDGGTVTITEEGIYVLTGTCSDGMVIVDVDKSAKVQLVLKGVTLSSPTSAAIYVKQADKVFVTLEDGTDNVLTSGSSYEAIDENNIDAVIFSKEDLTLGGTGSLTVESPAGHGIVSKDDLVFADGTYAITAAKDAISGKDSVRIAGGTFTLDAGDDGIRSGKDNASYLYICGGSFEVKAVDKGLGAGSLIYVTDGSFQVETKDDAFHSDHSIYIGGGKYEVTAGDDGFHADSTLCIADGTIIVAESYEGLEAQVIDIAGGEIDVTSANDGINAAGGNDGSAKAEGFGRGDMFDSDEDASITISGGVIRVAAEGDGLDSNGYITIKGGETYITGPSKSGNGSLDCGIEAVISGGKFVAAGAAGMAENFSDTSTQGCILVSTDSQAGGSKVQLLNAAGDTLVDWISDKAYECVLISLPELEKGQTYTLKAGTFSQEITMDTLVYGTGDGMGRGGRMNGGKFGGKRREEGGQRGSGRKRMEDGESDKPNETGDKEEEQETNEL